VRFGFLNRNLCSFGCFIIMMKMFFCYLSGIYKLIIIWATHYLCVYSVYGVLLLLAARLQPFSVGGFCLKDQNLSFFLLNTARPCLVGKIFSKI
jgi:hypothetical protein